MADIVTLHDGFHNADLQKSIERINKEGVWKKQRIVYMIPTAQKIMAEVYLSHRSIIFPPNQPMCPILVKEAEVGAAFQAGIDLILATPGLRDFEYFFTIEHDNIAQPNSVLRLLKAMDEHPEYSAISGLYWTKGEGGVPQIWGDIKDSVENYRPQPPQLDEKGQGKVVECWGIGMGFCLYRMEMFRELEKRQVPKPWFKTMGTSPEDNGVGTQDLYFWGRVARPNGFRCAVDCATTIGHIADDGRIW